MCLVLFSLQPGRLVVAANRDERFDRPSAPAAFWSDAPRVLGGRDLDKGGTWLGVTRGGRFAALTNVRDPSARRDAPRSRGQIVREFLEGRSAPEDFSRGLPRAELPAFNLICGDASGLWFVRDDRDEAIPIPLGVHGLSNARLDDAWPKVRRGVRRLGEWLERDGATEELFAVLDDRALAPDETLPSTGVPLEVERALSASHVALPGYGTRCSTVLLLRDGHCSLEERTFDAEGRVAGVARERFAIEADSSSFPPP